MRAIGGRPPEGFNYELFLDEKGQKISKSKGNGLTIDEWLAYASPESLSLFMYQKPTTAKRLYFDVIPRTIDDYLAFLDAYPRQAAEERLGNPVWHIRSGEPPPPEVLHGAGNRATAITFGVLLNLAAVANSEDPQVLSGFSAPLRAGCFGRDASPPRPAGRLCGPLFPRFRAPGEKLSRAGRNRARGTRKSRRRSRRPAPGRQRRSDSDRTL